MSLINTNVDVPFVYRHHCWFCSEPAAVTFTFPHKQHLIFDCPHPKLTVPSCNECRSIAIKAKDMSIWDVAVGVKKALMYRYRKDLAIGINWTKDELANAGFEDGNFSGFQKSAWFMFEVARDRVNFSGWKLSLNGIDVVKDRDEELSFSFDGVIYPSVKDAASHYVYAFNLDQNFFYQVLAKVGCSRFAKAVRFCRIYVGATPHEKSVALRTLE